MPITGAIAERVQAILPITWDALQSDTRYGDSFLQSHIDYGKESVTGTVVLPAQESTTYSRYVIDFIAKIIAIELIGPGIDLWMNEPEQETATGTNESHIFVDRADKLLKLRDAFLKETREKAGDVAEELGFTRSRSTGVPLSTTLTDPFLTPSPREFPRPYIETSES